MDDVPSSSLIHRETRTLVLLVVIAIAAFVATRTVARANQVRRLRDAQDWFTGGARALRDHHAADAARQLRRATALDPQNLKFRLALATALTASDASPEARRVLLDSRATAPRNAAVNLALGRLEATQGDTGATINAYQAALNNMWRPDDAAPRYQARTELARYLLAHDERSRALSELLILSADMPDTAAAHADVGTMFQAAAEPLRALPQLERSLALDPANQAVHLASGQAAFLLGDDTRALRHLRAAPDLSPAGELAETIALTVAHDPLAPRLSTRERERRLRVGLAQARLRLEGCDSSAPSIADASSQWLPQLDRFEASLDAGRNGPPVADLVDDGVELIARLEAGTATCGPPTPLDRALVLIGHRHEGKP